jgi:ABC-type glutathione transport system ATPase component
MSEAEVALNVSTGTGDKVAAAEVPIIETREVTRYFNVGHGSLRRGRSMLKAVDGVSLTISRGETLALVGETGSGKTTFGRLLLGLYKPTGGEILYRGSSMLDPRGETVHTVRRQIQGVFQDPYSSLNPTMTVGQSLTEVLKVHKPVAPSRRQRADANRRPVPRPGRPTAAGLQRRRTPAGRDCASAGS